MRIEDGVKLITGTRQQIQKKLSELERQREKILARLRKQPPAR